MIYLDSSATNPIDPRVRESMWPFLNEEYGNPSSKYYTLAENANKAVEFSRKSVAKLLNCSSDEIIFTSCATESNNFIIKGIANHYKKKGNHIITSKIEHKSVLESCKYLEAEGFEVTYLDVNTKGKVEFTTLKQALRENTILVSIMWGNNEIGTINDIYKLSKTVKDFNEEIFFHTDATQVIGRVGIDLSKIPIDFLSLSGHKMYAPKGIGACFIRKRDLGLRTHITPLLHGGSQEFGYRAGTLSVHNIVGIGKAAEITQEEFDEHVGILKRLERILIDKLEKAVPSVLFNGDKKDKIPGILNITIPGINNELIIRHLKDKYAISTGSACSINEPSYVLSEISLNKTQIQNSLRISLCKFVKEEEIKQFVNDLKETIEIFNI